MFDSIASTASSDVVWFWTTVILPSKWSGVLTLFGLVGWGLVARKHRVGWLFNIGTQGIWVAYGLARHEYFFLVSAAFLSTVCAYGFWNAGRRGRRAPASTPARAA